MSVAMAVAVLVAPVEPSLPPSPAPATVAASSPQQAPPSEPPVAAPETTAVASAADMASADPAPQADSAESDAIVVTGRAPIPGDPLESLNVASFEVVQAIDDAIIAPVAQGYEQGVPRPIRSGIGNVLNNLDEPVVFVNFLLQLKPGKAVETLARFAINSTIGAGGLIDVAKRKPFNLPRRSNGLADTFGYYGVKPGPYFYLPVIGSTTLRDMIGRLGDMALLPATVGHPFDDPVFKLSTGAVSALTERVELDADLRKAKASADPYKSYRDYYLKRREAEIDVLKGKRRSLDDPRPPERRTKAATAP